MPTNKSADCAPRSIHDRPTKKIEQTSLDILRRFLDAEEEEEREAARRLSIANKISYC